MTPWSLAWTRATLDEILYEARMNDLGSQLNAGRFALALNLTPTQVVDGLVHNRVVNEAVNVTFREGLRVEHTQIGHVPGSPPAVGERSDDWSSVAYWYQRLMDVPLPDLPDRAAQYGRSRNASDRDDGADYGVQLQRPGVQFNSNSPTLGRFLPDL